MIFLKIKTWSIKLLQNQTLSIKRSPALLYEQYMEEVFQIHSNSAAFLFRKGAKLLHDLHPDCGRLSVFQATDVIF